MAKIQAATHRGNCQICGHQQHVMGAVLAKHGYTVTFGFFSGTCYGSGQKPIQTQRSMTDDTIKQLGSYAADCDSSAAKLRSGSVHPTRILTGQKFNRDTHKYEPVFIDWADGTLDQQTKAQAIALAEVESDARHARSHASTLKTMADKLFGTALPLISDLEAKAAPAPKAVVDVKTAKVHGAFGSKAARKDELDKINRLYDKATNKLQHIYLGWDEAKRQEVSIDAYYLPMYPHQWKARHSALCLKAFPQAADVIKEIEELVAAREAVKAAP